MKIKRSATVWIILAMSALALSGCLDPSGGEDPVFTVTIAGGITEGTVSASPASGAAGTTVTLSNIPDSGYTFIHYTVNGTQISGSTFTLNENVTVSGVFVQLGAGTYTVTIAGGITGGTVSASPTSGAAGTTVTLSNIPDLGYTFIHYTVNGTQISGNIFTLNGNVTVGGVFSPATTGKTLSSIAITTQATKRTYTVGETLDTAGMVVTAIYSDGSQSAVNSYVISGFNSDAAAANQTVTVSYTEGGITQTATFTVTINAATLSSIDITTPPTKTTYTVGESLSTAGIVVTATYSNGSTAVVSGYTPSGFDSRAPATNQIVTVNYAEGGVTKTATFTVTIVVNKTAITALYWVNEQGQLVFTNGGTASITNAGSVTITPQGEGYTGQVWYVNGVEDRTKAGQTSYTFSGAGKTAGRYTIGLRAAKNGGYYYAECVVTVAN